MTLEGIERCVDTYLLLGKSAYKDLWKDEKVKRSPPPDANSILDIYGNVLFETCIKDVDKYAVQRCVNCFDFFCLLSFGI